MIDEYIPAEEVARVLGILTATLSKWRRMGRGPQNWVYRSKNAVLYPREDVDAYLATLPRRVEKSAILISSKE